MNSPWKNEQDSPLISNVGMSVKCSPDPRWATMKRETLWAKSYKKWTSNPNQFTASSFWSRKIQRWAWFRTERVGACSSAHLCKLAILSAAMQNLRTSRESERKLAGETQYGPRTRVAKSMWTKERTRFAIGPHVDIFPKSKSSRTLTRNDYFRMINYSAHEYDILFWGSDLNS